MRPLLLPPITQSAVLDCCLAAIPDPGLSARVTAFQTVSDAHSAQYNAHGLAQSFHLVPIDNQAPTITKDEFVALYSDHMSATKGAARAYYDALRNAAPNNKCPLCGIGSVTALDHHLPKSRYPYLAVCPYNLVPACDFCNEAKGRKYPKTAALQTIHPYYDDFSQEQWIFGQVYQGTPTVIQFHVSAPAHWPDVSQRKAQHHFEAVKLGVVYTSNANDDLVPLRGYLSGLFDKGGAAAVQATLAEEAQRYASRPNCWQHVTYQTLAQSSWFIHGGFFNIPT